MRTILAESRKYKLHLTLSTQFLSQFSDSKIRSNIESNTAIKLAGYQSRGTKSATENTQLMGTPKGALSKLNVGEFFIQSEKNPSYLIRVKPDLIDDTHAMKPEEWERVKQEQLQKYYRPIQPPEQAAQSYTYSFEGEKPLAPPTTRTRKKLN